MESDEKKRYGGPSGERGGRRRMEERGEGADPHMRDRLKEKVKIGGNGKNKVNKGGHVEEKEAHGAMNQEIKKGIFFFEICKNQGLNLG